MSSENQIKQAVTVADCTSWRRAYPGARGTTHPACLEGITTRRDDHGSTQTYRGYIIQWEDDKLMLDQYTAVGDTAGAWRLDGLDRSAICGLPHGIDPLRIYEDVSLAEILGLFGVAENDARWLIEFA